jgi:ribosomal protein S13
MPYDAFKIVYLVRSSTASKVRSERVVFLNINKLIITGSYRGSRHKMNHPVRGQRTRSNGNTQRRKRNLSKNVT